MHRISDHQSRSDAARRLWPLCLVLLIVLPFLARPALAECGGSVQCIGVGPTPAAAAVAHHTSGPTTFTLNFGNQVTNATSASQTVFVAAVTGPVGTMAVLGPVAITGANAAEFSVTGGTCSTTNGPVHGGAQCTITVAFTPASTGAKTATLTVPLNPRACPTCITGRVVTLAGTGTIPAPGAGAATLSVESDKTATLDLAPFVSGTGIQGVRITSAPTHGTASLNGFVVTYVPSAGYVGPDAFSYESFNSTGASPAANVTIAVVTRPNPAMDAKVVGLIGAQTQTFVRFARAQITNFQQRLESLRRRNADAQSTSAEAGGQGRSLQLRSASGLQRGIVVASNMNPALPSGEPYLAFPGRAAGSVGGPGGTGEMRTAASATGNAELVTASLANRLMAAASSGSLRVAESTEGGSGTSWLPEGVGIWMSGNLNFGTRDQTSDSSALRFRTDGVSAGIDRRFSDRLTLGLGVGYARDTTDVGTDGSRTRARGASFAAYGSYQPVPNTFVDGLVGYGSIDLDTDRFVGAANDYARGSRGGDQIFGSLAAGYEHRQEGLLLSPYGRLDFTVDRLDRYTEAGAGLNALTYFEHDQRTLAFSLGLRAESQHAASFGWVVPRLRVEFRHDFEAQRAASVSYADQFLGPRYSIAPASFGRDALLVGIGSDFVLRNGVKLGVDYQLQDSSGSDRARALRLWLAKADDGKNIFSGWSAPKLFARPVRVEAGYVWDSNVTRGSESLDRLADHIFTGSVSQSGSVMLGTNGRLVLSGFIDGDTPYRYSGLDRIGAGVRGELQYRGSAAFDAPIFGFFLRGAFDDYRSSLRSGYRYALGATARQSLTDRIDLFGSFTRNWRNADSAVFDGNDYAIKLNLDYALWASGTLYLSGEYRQGDTVSSGRPSLGSVAVAKSLVVDDAFPGQRWAYRVEARTVLWTLGYNWPLGPRDSIDFSWRHIRSTPTDDPDYTRAGAYAFTLAGTPAGVPSYTANQVSLSYLMRF